MKAIVQRWIEDSANPKGARGLSFQNALVEVDLKPLEEKSSWHVVEHLELLDGSAQVEVDRLPYLHRGFFDTHLHATWLGLRENDIELQNCRSFEEIVKKINAYCEKTNLNIVRGHGWEETRLGMSLEEFASKIEEALPEERPLILYRNCGHSAIVNKNLREQVKRNGWPALVTDQELESIKEYLPQPTESECRIGFRHAQEVFLKAGITAISDMGQNENEILAIRSLAQAGELRIDVVGVMEGGKSPRIEAGGPFVARNSDRSLPLNERACFSLRHWKKFLDGSFGSRTAWLSQNYSDGSGQGQSLCESETLIREAREALNRGFYLSFHAIGDAALDQALEVGAALGEEMGESLAQKSEAKKFLPNLHRVEHAQLIREDQVQKLQEQGFWFLAVQPGHQLSDVGFIEKRLGAERLQTQAYRAKTLSEAGLAFGLGSDAPIDPFLPEHVLRAVCLNEKVHERLRFDEAIWRYTTAPRLEQGLSPGKLGIGSIVCLTRPEEVLASR